MLDSYAVLITITTCKAAGLPHLVDDQRTLQATFAGAVCQQVGSHLLHGGQQGTTGAAGKQAEKVGEGGGKRVLFSFQLQVNNGEEDMRCE